MPERHNGIPGLHVSMQYRGFAGSEDNRQFIRESFTFSDSDSAIFFRLLRSIHDLDCLPRCNMQVLARTEDSVQQSAYGA